MSHPYPRDGIWRVIPSAMLTEICARIGLDFQILDCEHGQYDYSNLLEDIIACERNNCAPYVRVSGTDKVQVQRCLDLGAAGIVFPQLQGLADFEKAAAMMDYSPKGSRGFNPFVRAGNYGFGKEEGDDTSHPPRFIPIIETLEAVDGLDAILSIERIDFIYIGSYDLSAQLGCPGKMQDPDMQDVTQRIIEACAKHNKPASMMSLSPEIAKSLRGRNVDILVHGVESHRIREGLGAIINPES